MGSDARCYARASNAKFFEEVIPFHTRSTIPIRLHSVENALLREMILSPY